MIPEESTVHSLVRIAARLRACGKSWEEIGAAVSREPSTVRQWAHIHSAPWQESFDEQARQLVAEYGVQALERQHELAKVAESEAVKASANASITTLWAKLWPQRQEVTGKDGGPQVMKFHWDNNPAEPPKDNPA